MKARFWGLRGIRLVVLLGKVLEMADLAECSSLIIVQALEFIS